jgi:pyruvate carboxylase
LATASAAEKADPTSRGHIAAPFRGTVTRIALAGTAQVDGSGLIMAIT